MSCKYALQEKIQKALKSDFLGRSVDKEWIGGMVATGDFFDFIDSFSSTNTPKITRRRQDAIGRIIRHDKTEISISENTPAEFYDGIIKTYRSFAVRFALALIDIQKSIENHNNTNDPGNFFVTSELSNKIEGIITDYKRVITKNKNRLVAANDAKDRNVGERLHNRIAWFDRVTSLIKGGCKKLAAINIVWNDEYAKDSEAFKGTTISAFQTAYDRYKRKKKVISSK